VNPDLAALLTLQEDDTTMAAIDERLRELDRRSEALDGERAAVNASMERTRASAETAEKQRRDLAHKIEEHRAMQDRNLSVLDAVRKQREATAAMTQVDMVRRVLAQEESDLQSLNGRIADLKRAELEGEMEAARRKREASAARVPRNILSKYERIRGREKSFALYQLRGAACGRCNTAIPLQRRNVMAAGRTIEVCEGCGVLLYTTG
jgi:predicted  nucleic acid-binding Zn-ribbon protein